MRIALESILRPLARLAIAKGIRFADVSERLRRAYFDAAVDVAGENATSSNLSVMTGLQRRDVTRLLKSNDQIDIAAPNPLSRLVALWLVEFDGAPLPQHGSLESFDALARQIRKDIHPRTLLDRLVASGTVGIEGTEVRLLKKAHVPLEGSDEQIRYLGQNVGDHLAAAVGNVLGDPPSFDLAVHYDGLSDDSVSEPQTLWRERMTPVLEELNAKASEYQNQEPGPVRFRAGGYFRVEK